MCLASSSPALRQGRMRASMKMKGYVRASTSTVALPEELDAAAGRAVSDKAGRHIGRITDVIFDEFHVERAYVEIESDGAFEFSHRHFLAPVAALDLSVESGHRLADGRQDAGTPESRSFDAV